MAGTFDLRGSIERVVEASHQKAQAQGIGLICVIPRSIGGVRGDAPPLEAALAAMVEAALGLVARGELVLTVRRASGNHTQRPTPLRFRVYGRAGPPTLRANDAGSQTDGGGAALRQARRAAVAAGGDLRVQVSARGGVDLRFIAFYPPAPQLRRSARPIDWLQDARVLVVDESEPNRRSLKELLAACGCRAEGASGALQAMAILRAARAAATPVRLLMVSSELIEIPAAAFCHAVRSDPDLCATRLILVSRWGRRSNPADLTATGFAGELTRPVTRASLADLAVLANGAKRAVSVANLTRRASESGRRRRARVLLAEDSMINRRVTMAILENLGYRADSVANGVEALRALAGVPYDIVLMDVVMPVMGGLEAARRIRRGEAGEAARKIPILALTGHVGREVRTQCAGAGMNDFIAKPIDADSLRGAVTVWLSSAGLGTGPAEPADEEEALLDFSELLGRLGQDVDTVQALLAIFTRDLGTKLACLDDAITLGDPEQARRAAHALKGMARNASATLLAELAGLVEQLSREERLSDAAELLADLRQCRERTEARIDELTRGWKEIARR